MVAAKPHFLDLDFLVFSSHKTATQTLVKTLNHNGFASMHCHVLQNIGMKAGQFSGELSAFRKRNGKKLTLITTFRDPVERHISSFFQWYGSKPLIRGEVDSMSDTLIYRESIPTLQQRFLEEIDDRSLVGIVESLDHICAELQIDARELHFDEAEQFGKYECRYCSLFLLRFDLLSRNFAGILSRVVRAEVSEIRSANLSSDKWYRQIYEQFAATLTIPPEMLEDIYTSRMHLFEIFHPNAFEALFESALRKYSYGKQ